MGFLLHIDYNTYRIERSVYVICTIRMSAFLGYHVIRGLQAVPASTIDRTLFAYMLKEYTQLEFTWYTHSMYAFMYGEYVNCKRSVLVLFAFCYNYLCRRWKTILTHTHKHMQNTVDWRATATATSFGHQQKKQYTKPIPILLFSYLRGVEMEMKLEIEVATMATRHRTTMVGRRDGGHLSKHINHNIFIWH